MNFINFHINIQIVDKKKFTLKTGGYCKLNKELLAKQMDHMSALQSWAPELRNFVEFDERPIDTNKCDLVYEKPVYIMKIDASSYKFYRSIYLYIQ